MGAIQVSGLQCPVKYLVYVLVPWCTGISFHQLESTVLLYMLSLILQSACKGVCRLSPMQIFYFTGSFIHFLSFFLIMLHFQLFSKDKCFINVSARLMYPVSLSG